MEKAGQTAYEQAFEQAATALRAGQAAVFPTDTVWGLGVSPAACEAPAVLYRLKDRDEGKPVAWLVADAADLDRYGAAVPAYARDLAQRFWPGALTLIVRASDCVAPAFTSAAGTIGLRLPASPTARALIAAAASPLATTSANLSGQPAPLDFADVPARLKEACPCVPLASGDPTPSGLASTVVDCTGVQPRVLRQGSVVIDVDPAPASAL